jgi:hypothetical protein
MPYCSFLRLKVDIRARNVLQTLQSLPASPEIIFGFAPDASIDMTEKCGMPSISIKHTDVMAHGYS